MYTYQGRFCTMEELISENEENLFSLMHHNRAEYQKLVSREPISETFSNFRSQINQWFYYGRKYQFLVLSKDKIETVGTIFFYGQNEESGTIKISCFFVPKVRGKILVGEALGMAISFSFSVLDVDRLLFSIYPENSRMIQLAKKLGANEREMCVTTESTRNRSTLDYDLPRTILKEISRRVQNL